MIDVSDIVLPDEALTLLSVLDEAGAQAWAVGGCVRDALLGRPCSDVDIACSFLWEKTKSVCEHAGMRVHETGTKHGTVTVICNETAFEVTTFRTDGDYDDARHPRNVTFVNTIEEDLSRRDFTMNALAYRPDSGIIDPFHGIADMRAKTIRAVGDPSTRFSEDALRILRACRFSSELGFSIEPSTFQGMVENKALLFNISAERITHELQRLLLGPCAGTALIECVDVLAAVLPELVAMKGFDQKSPYHIYDVLTHTARVVDGVPPYPLVRWAALFHDMGKPASAFSREDGVRHFHAHPQLSVPIARGVMQRLTFSHAFMDKVLSLVLHHDDVVAASAKSVKKLLRKLDGDTDLFYSLCDLKRGDAKGKAPKYVDAQLELVNDIERIAKELEAEGAAFTVKSLAINGCDLIEAGCEPGPKIGGVLDEALTAVIEEEMPNSREELLEFARKLLVDETFSEKFKKCVDESSVGA